MNQEEIDFLRATHEIEYTSKKRIQNVLHKWYNSAPQLLQEYDLEPLSSCVKSTIAEACMSLGELKFTSPYILISKTKDKYIASAHNDSTSACAKILSEDFYQNLQIAAGSRSGGDCPNVEMRDSLSNTLLNYICNSEQGTKVLPGIELIKSDGDETWLKHVGPYTIMDHLPK
tara:strand:- start:66910 stop:67428 length:519 start_codon:yes stop_codon:yes gene_type:complete